MRKSVNQNHMIDPNLPLKPPERLALAYARNNLRAGLALLLAFDGKLADIIGNSREPMIAQMKIAWWNDVIAKQAIDRPKGEPMLATLEQLDDAQMNPSMRFLLNSWGLLAAHEQWDDNILAKFAENRSAAVFDAYAKWIGSDEDARGPGMCWAIADLRRRFGDRVPQRSLPLIIKWKTSRTLRPLSILALSVTKPTGPQLLWHALTGR
jgi:15-cis-phytoene synthase